MEELPWEFLFVMATLAVTIILPVILLVGFFDLRKKKLGSGQATGNELTTGELEDIIGDAVSEATADLEHELARLNRRLSTVERNLSVSDEPLLDEQEAHDTSISDISKSFGRLRT